MEGPRVRIEELRLAGFRAFENARLTLDDVTVLVGRNGAGKSTIVDAFEFLREALTDSLENALERRGGIQAVARRTDSRVWRGFEVAVKLRIAPDHAGFYGFRVERHSGRFIVAEETGRCGVPGRDFETGTWRPKDSALRLPLLAEHDSGLRMLLDALRTSLHAYRFSPAAIRAEPTIGRASLLSRDGDNAGDVLKQIEKNKDDLAWIVKHMGAVTPGIVGVKAGTAAGRRIVQFLQRAAGSVPTRFEIGDMSDGTLRSLAILLALRQTPTPALVCIDEIEDSVHPSALAVLLDAVAASTERCQVLLTSHSPEALSHPAVTASRVRVVDWSAGKSEIFRLSKGAEEAARPPRSVGTLLRSNALFTEEAPERVEGAFFAG